MVIPVASKSLVSGVLPGGALILILSSHICVDENGRFVVVPTYVRSTDRFCLVDYKRNNLEVG